MDLAIAESILQDQNDESLQLHTEKSFLNRKHYISKEANNQLPGSASSARDAIAEATEENYRKKLAALKKLLVTANNKLDLYINNEHVKRPESTVVELYLIFLRVGEIDNVKERFQVEGYFEASWIDNSVVPNAPFDPQQYWEPELFFENVVTGLKQDIKYRVEKHGDSVRVIECRHFRGVFWERLELWDFPLDIQDLSITITSARHKDEIRFIHSSREASSINTNDFQQQQEWNLYDFVDKSETTVRDVMSNKERPCMTFSSKISRKPGYFLYNAYMLLFLISTLGFAPFSYAYTLPHYRIQSTCLLILSSINFRWIVTQRLPTVSYLTTLDKYALCALVFLVVVAVWHAIIGSGIISAYQVFIDTVVLILIAVLFIIFHIVYVTFFLIKYLRYRNIKADDDSGHTELITVHSKEHEVQSSTYRSVEDMVSVTRVEVNTNVERTGSAGLTPVMVTSNSSATTLGTRKPINSIEPESLQDIESKTRRIGIINPKLNNPSNRGNRGNPGGPNNPMQSRSKNQFGKQNDESEQIATMHLGI